MTLKKLLQRAVNNVPVFRQIMNDEAQAMVRGEAPLTYSQCLSLVKSQAAVQDHNGGRSRTLNVMQHESTDAEDATDLDLISINRADIRTRLPQPIFESLPDDDRRAWIKMSPDAKASIVAVLQPGTVAAAPAPALPATRPSRSRGSKPRQVNFADTTDAPAESGDDAAPPESANDTLSVNKAVTTPAPGAPSTDRKTNDKLAR